MCAPALAQAELPVPTFEAPQTDQALFVPRLKGAFTFDAALESRLHPWARPEVFLPEDQLAFHLGYLHYLDHAGRLAVGGYLGGGVGLESQRAPAPPTHGRLDLGVVLRLRALSPRFFHGAFGLWGEGSLIAPSAPRADQRPAVGTPASEAAGDWLPRVAGGVEVGFGLLWFLDPYLSGEVLFRFGVEAVVADGVTHPALIGGIRFNFDWAQRLGAAADHLDDPEQPPPDPGGARGPFDPDEALERTLDGDDDPEPETLPPRPPASEPPPAPPPVPPGQLRPGASTPGTRVAPLPDSDPPAPTVPAPTDPAPSAGPSGAQSP